MDKLSPELLALVVTHVCAKPPPPGFINPLAPPPVPIRHAGLATLSRRWQHAIEAQTLANIKIKSTELSSFASVFGDARRRGLLRRLVYTVSLPTHGDSRENHATNKAAFAGAVRDLFTTLNDWEKHLPDHHNIGSFELELAADLDVDMADGPFDQHFDVMKSSASRRYLTLEGAELPAVRRVSKFTLAARPGRAPHPTAICQLAGAMPCLEKLDVEYLDPANKRQELRKEHRIAFAAGLRALVLPKLTQLRIGRYSTTEPYNHSFDCGDLEEGGIDSLNDAIRHISQSAPLTELRLSDILVSADLFRNRATSDPDPSTWPALRRFIITAGIVAPSGTWYYTGDPAAVEPGSNTDAFDSASDEEEEEEEEEEDDDWSNASPTGSDDPDRDAVANGTRPSHAWRTRPDPGVFDPLVGDVADAVRRMPQLQSGHFEVGVSYGEPIGVVFKVADAGREFEDRPDWELDAEEEKRTRRWRVWVGTAAEWEVPREVQEKFEEWLGAQGKLVVGRWPPSF